MKTLTTLVLAALFALGCGTKDDSDKTAKPADDEPATKVGPGNDKAATGSDRAMPDPIKVEAFMKATIAAANDAGGDCAKLAAPVVELANRNADLLAEMAATAASVESKQWKSENAELYAGFSKALRAIGACARQQPELVKVLQSLSPKKPARTGQAKKVQ